MKKEELLTISYIQWCVQVPKAISESYNIGTDQWLTVESFFFFLKDLFAFYCSSRFALGQWLFEQTIIHNIFMIPTAASHLCIFENFYQCQINITILNVFNGGWWIEMGVKKWEYRQENRNWFVIVWVFYLIEFDWLLLKRRRKEGSCV